MKCLEKDRARRYGRPRLAQDVGRYLADEPVQACPPSGWYRFGKFARRNKVALAAALMAAAALLVAVAALAVATVQITEALGDKTRALDDANSARAQTEQANGDLGKTLVALTAEQQKTKQAHDEERRTNYDHLVALADREWSLNNVASAEAALTQCPAEFHGWEWHYLNRRMQTEELIVGKPGVQYMGAAYSPDGKYLAVAGDGVKVLDADTGREVRPLAAPLRGTKWSPLAFSHDGQRVAVVRTTQGTLGNELIGLISVFDVKTAARFTPVHYHTGRCPGLHTARTASGWRQCSPSCRGAGCRIPSP